MKFPLFKCMISEDDKDDVEVDYIALVDKPAIQSNFLAFKEVSKLQTFAITNESEQIITGLAMIADLPMYRKDEDGEYYTFFDAETIKKIAQRFFRKKYNFNLNLNHDPNYVTSDVYVFESWIVDRENGKLPMEQFKDVENGSWIISAKIDNAEIWAAVKRGEFKGFSVEGFFKMERVTYSQMTEETFDKELIKLIQEAKF